MAALVQGHQRRAFQESRVEYLRMGGDAVSIANIERFLQRVLDDAELNAFQDADADENGMFAEDFF